jgi:hypothetical protein
LRLATEGPKYLAEVVQYAQLTAKRYPDIR